jgi:signal transduction histidine kinase/CHASE3 domain sensor protein
MNLKSILTSSLFIRSILVISLFALIFIFSVSYKHTIALRESTELLVHSYRIQIKLEQLLSCLKDAETGQRGFIISGDSLFLQPYNTARAEVNKQYSELASTLSNPDQKHNLDSLVTLINLRFSLLEKSLSLNAYPEINKADLDANMVEGNGVMNRIRAQINNMTDLENLHFEAHKKKFTHEIYFTPNFTLFLSFFTLLVFLLSFIKISNDLTTLNITNGKLRVTTEAFRHAEKIGRFSSWQWHLESNKFIYSDNQYGLLGCEPQSFEATAENFLEFVHPDDRTMFSDAIKLAVNEEKPLNISFRIIRKDGELRYFKSVSNLTELNGKNIFIGINSDITEQHISNIALEERNRELEQTNKELGSFNHIASHDLQEPLRKIQIFISRINEKEVLNLSDNGKEYFNKIKSSVVGMRNLIDDLLQFSRTGKAEKNFEVTSLNLLLDNAKQELIQDIEDKKAVIDSDELPVINVIPFQIQQLFINLIGNSLKYSRPGKDPEIRITCEETGPLEFSSTNEDKLKKYYKISVKDNGLGFDQQYAEDIFMLFFRLHPKSEFAGSGIGLSICKKIIENHNGFITAQGNPGEGSVFSFFLPA